MEKLAIFKVGGKILDDAAGLATFLAGFARLPGKKILVHGGGLFADQLAERLQISITMHEGRRITTPAMRDVVTMVYGGLLNKQIVSQLQTLACDAIGLTGADGAVLRAERRHPEPIDYGCVGDIQDVRTEFLEIFLERSMVPVLAPLSWSPAGEILNSNADSVACKITEAFAGRYETYLLYCFDKPGVLTKLTDERSLLPDIDRSRYERLRAEQVIHSGMLPKLESCFRAKALGAHRVLISSPEQSLRFMAGASFQGTLIT